VVQATSGQSYGVNTNFEAPPTSYYGQSGRPIKPYKPYGEPSFVQSQFSSAPNQLSDQGSYGQNEKPLSYGHQYNSNVYSSSPSKPPQLDIQEKPEADDLLPPFVGHISKEDQQQYPLPAQSPYGQSINRPSGKPEEEALESPPNAPPYVQSPPRPTPPPQFEVPFSHSQSSLGSYGQAPRPIGSYGGSSHKQNPNSQPWVGPFSSSYLDTAEPQRPNYAPPQPAKEITGASQHPYGQKPQDTFNYVLQRPSSSQGYGQPSSNNKPASSAAQYQPQGSHTFEQKPTYAQKPSFEQIYHQPALRPSYGQPQASDIIYGQPKPSAPISPYQDSPSSLVQKPQVGPSSLAAFVYGPAHNQGQYLPTHESPVYNQPPLKGSQSSGPAGQPLADETPSQQVPPLLQQLPIQQAALEPPVDNSESSGTSFKILLKWLHESSI